ncbi:hypothetical protein ABPG75_010354 [Micractinium tetrahymenae]
MHPGWPTGLRVLSLAAVDTGLEVLPCGCRACSPFWGSLRCLQLTARDGHLGAVQLGLRDTAALRSCTSIKLSGFAVLVYIPDAASRQTAELTSDLFDGLQQAPPQSAMLQHWLDFFAPLFQRTALLSLEVRATFLSFCSEPEDVLGYAQPQHFGATATLASGGLVATVSRPAFASSTAAERPPPSQMSIAREA